MKLGNIIKGMDTIGVHGNTSLEITGITKDSRNVSEGSLFFVTSASSTFREDAFKRGASAVVTDAEIVEPFGCVVHVGDVMKALGQAAANFYHHPSRKAHITGITGTNGKTTTTYLIESIFRSAGKEPGVIGTISYRYAGNTFRAANTTPGASEINGLLNNMVSAGTSHVIMEVSSHALHQARVEGIDFDIAVFTNLTHDHLDYHGNFANYGAAKRLLFEDYLPRSMKKKKYAILNIDDPSIRDFVIAAPVTMLSYSTRGFADACLSGYSESIDGLNLTINLPGRKIPIASPLIGMFNASNILAAALSGYATGISHRAIKEGIERLNGVPGRLERVANDRGIPVFVDYAHTPDAIKNVLSLLGRLKKGRLIIVFGCGGNRDTAKRPIMGALASRLADEVIITSDNPRNEDPGQIIADITRGVEGKGYRIIEDRREAIFESIRAARPDDVVLVAGKGHEDYQIVGDSILHFSDREVVEEYFHVAT
ncbi:MAG: UDP-N-acetylmuramoyl-L-alanyl-D-glutamate--2,6-diaminopimelate ligase [Deltaproteobacteria bacterium]|nr:UDP-N-acetylmuramoyl-L-alanyl-D-glutamate--2,6-diaminopimelate ligase [Deltaproteobacteria bacterium]